MSYIISIHSFRGGTGKSNSSANISAILAMKGLRVCVVDTDINSPGIHVLFGMNEDDMGNTLNDFLWGKCQLKDAVYDVTHKLVDRNKRDISNGGKLFLCPASIRAGEIARILKEGYDVGLLNDGFHSLLEDMQLDVLVIDTHPGINEETLLSIAISDALAIIMRPDQQDFQGTSVTVDVAKKLEVPNMVLVINKVPNVYDLDDLRSQITHTYDTPVAGVIPHSDDLMALSSSDIFCLQYPDHFVSDEYRKIAARLLTSPGG